LHILDIPGLFSRFHSSGHLSDGPENSLDTRHRAAWMCQFSLKHPFLPP